MIGFRWKPVVFRKQLITTLPRFASSPHAWAETESSSALAWSARSMLNARGNCGLSMVRGWAVPVLRFDSLPGLSAAGVVAFED
jgi:hypothetical protein